MRHLKKLEAGLVSNNGFEQIPREQVIDHTWTVTLTPIKPTQM